MQTTNAFQWIIALYVYIYIFFIGHSLCCIYFMMHVCGSADICSLVYPSRRKTRWTRLNSDRSNSWLYFVTTTRYDQESDPLSSELNRRYIDISRACETAVSLMKENIFYNFEARIKLVKINYACLAYFRFKSEYQENNNAQEIFYLSCWYVRSLFFFLLLYSNLFN